MATPSEMVALLKAALEKNPGVVKIRHNNREVSYDRDQAMRELAKWEQKAATESSTTGALKLCELSLKGQN